MIRALIYLGLLAGLMLGVAWLAERPGDVTIVWQGWRVDTSVGVLAAIVVAIAVATALVYRFWRALVTAPRRFGRWRRQRRTQAGYQALSAGLVAVAAGDPAGARKLARRADRMLEQPSLTLLLSAQAAQLTGDEATAQRHFAAMLERPETEFLGLRGLLSRALRAGDLPQALTLAKRAHLLRPKTPWVLTTLLDLQTRLGDWEGAADTLAAMESAKIMPPGDLRHHQGAVFLELSRAALAAGAPDDALRHAKRAYDADPDHPMTPAWLAERLIAAGRPRRAAKLVEREWMRRPHPDLLQAYRRVRGSNSALEWAKQVQELAALAPAHVDSHRALGEAALAAQLWGDARKHFTAAIAASGDEPPASLCRKMAEVEEGSTGDAALVRPWLSLAAEGHPDVGWICDACGTSHGTWRAVCGRCGAFDRLGWRTPQRVAPVLLARAAPLPALESGAPPA
jgi:HemY protein